MTRREIPTVIVSHQLDRIASLCSEAILLEQGRVSFHGDPAACVAHYISSASSGPDEGDQPIRLKGLRLAPGEGVRSGDRFTVSVAGEVVDDVPAPLVLRLRVAPTDRPQVLFSISSRNAGLELPRRGGFELVADLQANLPGGFYLVEAGLFDFDLRAERGPRVHAVLRVEETHAFAGLVHMHPRLSLSNGSDARRAAALGTRR
jgi:hypothetical protein